MKIMYVEEKCLLSPFYLSLRFLEEKKVKYNYLSPVSLCLVLFLSLVEGSPQRQMPTSC